MSSHYNINGIRSYVWILNELKLDCLKAELTVDILLY